MLVGHLDKDSAARGAEGPLLSEVGDTALSLGERVASGASRVRGYSVRLRLLIPPHPATDPSPVPLRLMKTPAAGHPLPKGEGKDPNPCHSPARRGEVRTCRPKGRRYAACSPTAAGHPGMEWTGADRRNFAATSPSN